MASPTPVKIDPEIAETVAEGNMYLNTKKYGMAGKAFDEAAGMLKQSDLNMAITYCERAADAYRKAAAEYVKKDLLNLALKRYEDAMNSYAQSGEWLAETDPKKSSEEYKKAAETVLDMPDSIIVKTGNIGGGLLEDIGGVYPKAIAGLLYHKAAEMISKVEPKTALGYLKKAESFTAVGLLKAQNDLDKLETRMKDNPKEKTGRSGQIKELSDSIVVLTQYQAKIIAGISNLESETRGKAKMRN
ncbi:hypothetical protein KJ780_03405 [Candidatus Micrarchaeota archaeon]|nr:hypothetical protein [Candidatus Micrarchaeota archaeon]